MAASWKDSEFRFNMRSNKTMQEDKNNIVKLNNEQLRLLQLNELAMLIEVDRICRKNNIKYTLAGGTMLGAVRHKGFIPWDDDIDVRFKREEYEKFYEACKKDLDNEHFFLQEYRTDPNYRWGYSKMRLKGSEFIRIGQEHMHYVTGVNIDIFITDNIPDNAIQRRIQIIKLYCLRKIMYSEVGMKNSKNVLMRLWYRILYLIPRDFSVKIYNNMVKKSNKMKATNGRCLLWWESYVSYRGMALKFLDEYTELEFEGMKFSVVKDWDEYLTISYGDYMKLPPVEKRVSAAPASKIELLNITLKDLQDKYSKENGYY